VVPVASDQGLRTRAWIERIAEGLMSCRVDASRMYGFPIPAAADTAPSHVTIYSQQQKDGAIIDEPKPGGMVADSS